MSRFKVVVGFEYRISASSPDEAMDKGLEEYSKRKSHNKPDFVSAEGGA
jgi:hypothetical protein